MSSNRGTWWLTVVLLLATIPIAGCDRVADVIPGNDRPAPAASATATVTTVVADGSTAIADAQLARSIVQIEAMTGEMDERSIVRSGSGVIVDAEQRLVLTSYGVVQPFGADGTPAYATLVISPHRRLDEPPHREFEAELVAADPAAGIAVLQVTRDVGSGSLTPGRFDLPAASLGDPRAAAAGFPVRIFGDRGPGSGGPQTLAIHQTSITGVRGAPGVTNRTSLKLQTGLPSGSNGGGAFNQSGALIGILAQDRYLATAEVAQLLPLELAVPVIERARTDTARYLAPIRMHSNIPGTTRVQPDQTVWVSAPVFSANAIQHPTGYELFDYSTRFPAGRPALYYEYVLQGVPEGAMIEERWFMSDAPQDSLSSSYRWTGGSFAVHGDRITAPGAAGIPSGRWRLEVWVAGALRAQATAFIDVEPGEPTVTPTGSGSSATVDARPLAPATTDSTQALAFFDFAGMEGAQTLDWLVFFNNQRVYTSPSLRWDYGDTGRAWVGYTPGHALGPGTWEIELHVDGRVMAVLPISVP